MDETLIIGDLPNLKVEISRRSDAQAGAEIMTISLRATPDFQSALPLALNFAQMTNPMVQPLALWSQVMESWMAPWTRMAQGWGIAAPWAQLMNEKPKG